MKKWALVLSGGGGSGIAHIGAVKALKKMGYTPDFIAGNSIGAVIGSILACGTEIEDLEEYIMTSFDVLKLMDGFVFHLPNTLFSRILMAEGAMHNMMIKKGADSGKLIVKKIKELTAGKTFDETTIPFACNATDLLTGTQVLLNKGIIADAVHASLAYPGVFAPVEKDNMLLCDGAMIDNMPVWIARKYGYTNIIAIDVDPFLPSKKENMANGLAIVFRGIQILTKHVHKPHTDKASIVITACDANSNFDFENKKKLIDIGEKAVMQSEKKIRNIIDPLWTRIFK